MFQNSSQWLLLLRLQQRERGSDQFPPSSLRPRQAGVQRVEPSATVPQLHGALLTVSWVLLESEGGFGTSGSTETQRLVVGPWIRREVYVRTSDSVIPALRHIGAFADSNIRLPVAFSSNTPSDVHKMAATKF